MRRYRLVAYVAVACFAVGLSARVGRRKPVAGYYCCSANPSGLTHSDGHTGDLTRFAFDAGINSILTGPSGYCAVDTEHMLTLFRNGKRLQALQFPEPDIAPKAWLGDTLLFSRTWWPPGRGEETFYSLVDAKTGTVKPWTGRDMVRVTPAPPGFVGVRQSDHDKVTTTLYDRELQPARSWSASGRGVRSPVWVGGRFAVVAVKVDDVGCDLWRYDSVTGDACRLAARLPVKGACQGRSPNELLLGVATAVTKRLDAVSTRVEAVDLLSLRRTVVTTHEGEFHPAGLSTNGRWLLGFACIPDDKIGRLDAVRLSDGKVRVLQSNVRDVAIAPP